MTACSSNTGEICYEDLVAYAEDGGDTDCIRYARTLLELLDIDNDSVIGFLDFIHFAARRKLQYTRDLVHTVEERNSESDCCSTCCSDKDQDSDSDGDNEAADVAVNKK